MFTSKETAGLIVAVLVGLLSVMVLGSYPVALGAFLVIAAILFNAFLRSFRERRDRGA